MIDLSFLRVANGDLTLSDDEVGEELCKNCHRAAELIEAGWPANMETPSGAINLSEYEPDFGLGSYLDDMVTLVIEAEEAGVTIIWPEGIEPDYE